jgi:formylglycine-generating enzyme required for sulfatase activity
MKISEHPLVNLLFVSIFSLVLSSCNSGTTTRSENQFTTFTEKYGSIEFVKVPKGSFTMGNTGSYSGRKREYPIHTVTFANDFYVGKYEVTQAQWDTVMGETPSRFSQCGTDCPVEKVSWDSVQEFIKNINRETGKTYRLLSEAEWEYVAKAGTTTDTYAGDLDIKGKRNVPILDAISYYSGNSGVKYPGGHDCSGWEGKQYDSDFCGSHSVGGKQANAFGLYDMMGNVWEWTQDCSNDNYTGAPRDASAWLEGSCSHRIIRGGSWWASSKGWRHVRSSSRSRETASHSIRYLGFRLALSASEL